MPLIVNGIDVNLYAASFEEYAINSVQQFLRTFGCCPELRVALEAMIEERLRVARMTALERRKMVRQTTERLEESYLRREMMVGEDRDEGFPGEPQELPVIGICPKCNLPLAGMFIQKCEAKKSGRIFIKECTKCSYYSELFVRRGNVYEEIEGG